MGNVHFEQFYCPEIHAQCTIIPAVYWLHNWNWIAVWHIAVLPMDCRSPSLSKVESTVVTKASKDSSSLKVATIAMNAVWDCGWAESDVKDSIPLNCLPPVPRSFQYDADSYAGCTKYQYTCRGLGLLRNTSVIDAVRILYMGLVLAGCKIKKIRSAERAVLSLSVLWTTVQWNAP